MIPLHGDERVTIWHGDALEVLALMQDECVDAIVTDPPYGLGFMGKAWDNLPPGLPWARECLRVLKPGGYLLAFGGTRTWHRLACAVEDAGFEVRDSIAWLYGSGFPKSLNLPGGLGTALKPAFEPIVCARKPLSGTVALNVERYGTGALNVDACRVGGRERTDYGLAKSTRTQGATYGAPTTSADFDSSKGRWPANVVLDDSQAAELDAATWGKVGSNSGNPSNADGSLSGTGDVFPMGPRTHDGRTYDQRGTFGASRFFPTFRYQAKAPTHERPRHGDTAHPTVKPLALMQWLVRLVTPPGGIVLEPFAGSGTTVEACIVEGFHCIAIEREADYLPLIMQRVNRATETPPPADELSLFDIDEEEIA